MRRFSSDRFIVPEISSAIVEPEPVAVRAVILLNPEPVVLESQSEALKGAIAIADHPDIIEVGRIPEEAEVSLNLPNIVVALE